MPIGDPLPHCQDTGCVYLDYNGTTPIFPEVVEAMQPFLEQFGNPSSSHVYGRMCKAAVDKARCHVAQLIHCDPDEIVFTSCGTESDNWAIIGAVMAARRDWITEYGKDAPTPHVVTSTVEHPAVLQCLRNLESQGLTTFTAVPVDATGRVEPSAVTAALTPSTVLVTIMHSNNEVGTIQPISDICASIASHYEVEGSSHSCHPVLVHTDAAQSVGKVAIDVKSLGVNMATIVGHKFGAPKGVAALYIRHGTRGLYNLLHGGGQEGGRRAGTENVLLVVGLGRAAELSLLEQDALTAHMRTLRDSLQQQLQDAFPKGLVRINGPSFSSQRLPNTLSISIRGLSSAKLLESLSDRLAASAGAACHTHHDDSGKHKAVISSVLEAMGVPEEFALGTLRLSVGRHSTQDDVDAAVAMIVEEVSKQITI